MMLIDLRSDTLTKPTPGMLERMWQAQVGDDVYDEDPTIKELELRTAAYFGMEAGLFCPSGTMANQIGIRALTQPNDEIICDRLSHIYNYEGGGLASNSLLSVRLLEGTHGIIRPEQILDNINTDNIHYPRTSIVALENTVNKGGGNFYTLSQIREIYKVCEDHSLSLHLDGARLWNALVADQQNPQEYGQYFDTISVCFSKGLGCPVGSVLLGSEKIIKKAKRIRKVMGGGWRQAGYLAAAGLYALEHHVSRLMEDHQRALAIAHSLGKATDLIEKVYPVQTNIIIAEVKSPFTADQVVSLFKEHHILISAFSKKQIRLVTHLDFTDQMLANTLEALTSIIDQPEVRLF